jgi:hypothetical protein
MSRKNDRPPIQFRIRTLLLMQAIVVCYIAMPLWHNEWTLVLELPSVAWLVGVAMALDTIHVLRSHLKHNDFLVLHEGELQPPSRDLVYQIRENFWGDLQWSALVGSTTPAFVNFVAHTAMHTPSELLNPLFWFLLAFGAVIVSVVATFLAPWCGLAYVRLWRRLGVWH